MTADFIKIHIEGFKEDLEQLEFIIENGATLEEYCNNKNDLRNDYNTLMKYLKEYIDQYDLKQLEILESEIF